MDVGVVGAGRVGTALAVLLQRAGHRVVGVSGGPSSKDRATRFLPDVPFAASPRVAAAAGVVVLAVPDDRIAAVCTELADEGAFRAGQSVLHTSGAVPLSALEPAAHAGAGVLSLHPLQTFPTVEAALERLPGSAVAVTAADERGYGTGERLAGEVGGRPFRLPDELKPLYHAAAVCSSNYVTVLVAVAERLFRGAGLAEPLPALAPLARAALENALALGPSEALTGPAVRGDAGTIRRNLEALSTRAPDVVPLYLAMARAAVDLGTSSGRLDHDRRAGVEEVLAAWS